MGPPAGAPMDRAAAVNEYELQDAYAEGWDHGFMAAYEERQELLHDLRSIIERARHQSVVLPVRPRARIRPGPRHPLRRRAGRAGRATGLTMISPYDVRCPVCDTHPGANCRAVDGRVLTEPHVARLELAWRDHTTPDEEPAVNRQAEADYRAHSSSVTGIEEEP